MGVGGGAQAGEGRGAGAPQEPQAAGGVAAVSMERGSAQCLRRPGWMVQLAQHGSGGGGGGGSSSRSSQGAAAAAMGLFAPGYGVVRLVHGGGPAWECAVPARPQVVRMGAAEVPPPRVCVHAHEQKTKKLPPVWKYESSTASTLVA